MNSKSTFNVFFLASDALDHNPRLINVRSVSTSAIAKVGELSTSGGVITTTATQEVVSTQTTEALSSFLSKRSFGSVSVANTLAFSSSSTSAVDHSTAYLKFHGATSASGGDENTLRFRKSAQRQHLHYHNEHRWFLQRKSQQEQQLREKQSVISETSSAVETTTHNQEKQLISPKVAVTVGERKVPEGNGTTGFVVQHEITPIHVFHQSR